MTSVSWRVPAKTNLSLAVGPLRTDGYHDLATVFHAISLADVVTASTPPGRPVGSEAAGGGSAAGSAGGDVGGEGATRPALTIAAAHDAVDVEAVPLDGSNLAVRAAEALAARLGRPAAVTLHVDKAIPVSGGLAGGSADAAGALLACNDLWAAGLSAAELTEVAAGLGSDVPFALLGGTALGSGRGEVLSAVDVGGELHWVVVAGRGGLSTPAVYRRLDDLRASGRVTPRESPATAPQLVAALGAGDVTAVAAGLTNDMEAAALDLAPELAGTLAAGRRAGAAAGIVSGSGPTCVFLAPTATAAGHVARALERDGYAGRVMTATGPRAPQRVDRSRVD